MEQMFEDFTGKVVDFSNVKSDSTSFVHQFNRANIDYVNMTNGLYYNLNQAVGLFYNGMFKVLDFSNTIADELLDFPTAFTYSYIENIIMKNFSTKNLMNIYSIFKGTNFTGVLKSIDISGWNISNIEDIRFMFENSNIEYINASGINLNDKVDILYDNMFTGTDNLKEILFDFNKYTFIRDILLNNGFTCENLGCKKEVDEFLRNIKFNKTIVDNQGSLIRKNNKNLRDDKFTYNGNIIDKDKFNITVENVDITLDPNTGRDNMFIRFKVAINDYLINPFMKFFRLR